MVTVGDALDHLGDAENLAGGILHPEGRHRDDQLPVRVVPQAAGLLGEDQRIPRFEHPSQSCLHCFRAAVPYGDDPEPASSTHAGRHRGHDDVFIARVEQHPRTGRPSTSSGA